LNTRLSNPDIEELASFGIEGVDSILRGGLPPYCLYVVSGTPGAGKTTLALQFLLEGARVGESCLYITLSETRKEIEKVALSHGWDLKGITMREMMPSENRLGTTSELTVFNPSELELGETTEAMIAAVRECRPSRVVIDSLSELRLVAQSELRFRRQVLALKQFFSGQSCTTLLLDDETAQTNDGQLESVAHGVIILEQIANQYGAERRRLRVVKLRGVAFRGGYHDFVIRRGGLDVFPRLVAAEHVGEFPESLLPSGNSELDTLLCGGLPAGTSTLLLGPAGTGKSTIATQFCLTAAQRGERSAMFIFDENLGTFRSRSRSLGISVDRHLDNGLITMQQIDPAELSPGEFANAVRRAALGKDASGRPARVIVIDSLNGYLNAMPEEKYLTAQLHELLTFLGQQGVLTLMSVTQSGMLGHMHTPVDTTYLADNVILFRYFEARGEVRRAVSVVKKRSGPHELTIREMKVNEKGLTIGPPLVNFHGVLSGIPQMLVREEAEGKGDWGA